jgi:hypothetical protein
MTSKYVIVAVALMASTPALAELAPCEETERATFFSLGSNSGYPKVFLITHLAQPPVMWYKP